MVVASSMNSQKAFGITMGFQKAMVPKPNSSRPNSERAYPGIEGMHMVNLSTPYCSHVLVVSLLFLLLLLFLLFLAFLSR